MPFVFVPRRKDRLDKTARLLKKRGFTPITFPLVKVTPQKIQLPLGVEGIVVTSSAALKTLPNTDLPLYCVGESTAEHATESGFDVAYVGSGNGADLAEYLAETLPPQHLAHPTAKDVEKGWYTPLEKLGFTITPLQAYSKTYKDAFSTEVVCCLSENKVSYTLVFSVQAARQLQTLCQHHHLPVETLGTVVAISDKVAAQFNNKDNIMVAPHPQLQEMLNVLEQTTQQN
jgi:uroporphyrinogen-III synthase